MLHRRWTILIMNDDGSGVRQIRLTPLLSRGLVGVCLMLVLGVISGASQLVGRIHGPTRTYRLERENLSLRGDLEEVRERANALNATLDRFTLDDRHFRLLAGLDPLDDEVRQAGIGGPDLATLRHAGEGSADHAAHQRVFGLGEEVNAMLRRARLLQSSRREAYDSLKFQHEKLSRTPSIQPTEGYISSAFARWRAHPILDLVRAHQGIDIPALQGTPIVASAKGRVRFAGRNGEYGLTVEIDHGFNTVTRYAHASKTLVRPGQNVQRGDTIALVGSTGLAEGSHLHYEVLVGGRAVNPRQYLLSNEAIPD